MLGGMYSKNGWSGQAPRPSRIGIWTREASNHILANTTSSGETYLQPACLECMEWI